MKESNSPAKRGAAVLRGSLILVVLCILPQLATAVYNIADGVTIGVGNSVNNQTSLAVGSEHVINGYSGMLASGMGHTVFGAGSSAFGSGHYVTSENGLAAGIAHTVSGGNASALGYQNIVTGQNALAAGQLQIASGPNSAALGCYNTSSGWFSVATGYRNESYGTAAQAHGIENNAWSYGTTVIGQFSAPVGAEYDERATARDLWRPQDPVFVIGGGSSNTNRSNLLVVKKDGEVDIAKLKLKGGIPNYVP